MYIIGSPLVESFITVDDLDSTKWTSPVSPYGVLLDDV